MCQDIYYLYGMYTYPAIILRAFCERESRFQFRRTIYNYHNGYGSSSSFIMILFNDSFHCPGPPSLRTQFQSLPRIRFTASVAPLTIIVIQDAIAPSPLPYSAYPTTFYAVIIIHSRNRKYWQGKERRDGGGGK